MPASSVYLGLTGYTCPANPYSVRNRTGWLPMRSRSADAPTTATARGLSRRENSGESRIMACTRKPTAQRKPCPGAVSVLLQRDLGRLDHLRILGDLVAHELGELFARTPARNLAALHQAIANVVAGENLGYVRVDLAHDVGGRACGREQAEEGAA